jgi:hypothetical protein
VVRVSFYHLIVNLSSKERRTEEDFKGYPMHMCYDFLGCFSEASFLSGKTFASATKKL